MWESRVLGEISKSLWEPLFGFHRDAISTAAFASHDVIAAESGGCCTLAGSAIVAPSAFYAVAFHGRVPHLRFECQRRRRGTNGPGGRRRPEEPGAGESLVFRERSVR